MIFVLIIILINSSTTFYLILLKSCHQLLILVRCYFNLLAFDLQASIISQKHNTVKKLDFSSVKNWVLIMKTFKPCLQTKIFSGEPRSYDILLFSAPWGFVF